MNVLTSSEPVLGRGPGVQFRPDLQLGQAMLWRGLSGQRQPPEVLLHPSVGHEGEDPSDL